MKIQFLLFFLVMLVYSNEVYTQGEITIPGHLSITKIDTINASEHVLVRKTDGSVAKAQVNKVIKPENPQLLPFYSGWDNYGAGYQEGTFYKYGNRVHFDGLIIKESNIMYGDTICILPEDYRPDRRMIAHGKQNATPLRLNFEPDGTVWAVANGSDWIDITGISFYKNDNLEIGDSHEGGIVFYIANPLADLDGDGDLDQGMVVAPYDQGTTEWGCFESIIEADGTDIGTGYDNSQLIVNLCSGVNVAAKICDGLELNGYSDWFLPSFYELKEAHKSIGIENNNIGNFSSSEYYWTSTESNLYFALVNRLDTPYNTWNLRTKDFPSKVRAIRVF